MDKLKQHCNNCVFVNHVWSPKSDDPRCEFDDHIIIDVESDCENWEPDDDIIKEMKDDELKQLRIKVEQQAQYAELGRLAVEVFNNNDGTEDTEICCANYWSSYKGDNEVCESCIWRNFCQKRAKLLAGEK